MVQRLQQGVPDIGPGGGPGVSQRRLRPAGRMVATAVAALAHARRSYRDPFRSRQRRVPLHAGDRSSAPGQAHSPVRNISGGRIMTSLLWTLIAIQIVMGVFDT